MAGTRQRDVSTFIVGYGRVPGPRLLFPTTRYGTLLQQASFYGLRFSAGNWIMVRFKQNSLILEPLNRFLSSASASIDISEMSVVASMIPRA